MFCVSLNSTNVDNLPPWFNVSPVWEKFAAVF
jgi:hypothetical protein